MAILNTVRGLHVTPNIYTKETQIKPNSNTTIGPNTLGLVGETLMGPAFQPTQITTPREFADIFGGTSTEIYKGSKYPRYELPYIAQDYLTESNQLFVTRVLGLSGYNAGPAWLIKSRGKGEGEDMLVAVLRSRGHYEKTTKTVIPLGDEITTTTNMTVDSKYIVGKKNLNEIISNDYYITYNEKRYYYGEEFIVVSGHLQYTTNSDKLTVYELCDVFTGHDKMVWDTNSVTIAAAAPDTADFGCGKLGQWTAGTTTTDVIKSNTSDYGTFKITVTLNQTTTATKEYIVSLNPGSKNYIYNVLGSTPTDNDAPIYVEELYDVALRELIYKNGVDTNNFINGINTTVVKISENELSKFLPVDSLLTIPSELITGSMVGKRFLFTQNSPSITDSLVGEIFKVEKETSTNGKVSYKYTKTQEKLVNGTSNATGLNSGLVFVNDEQVFYEINSSNTTISMVKGNMSDYKEAFRYATSPWVVSQMIGTYGSNELKKLFRFHTISDGNTANTLVKVSIQNINPDTLTFDVVVRDFYDGDDSIVVLESFPKCSLNPNSSNYILNKIGAFDNSYPLKSKYVMVEMSENDNTRHFFPAGFLGYPVRDLGDKAVKPRLTYNTTLKEEIRSRRQYFGMSDIVGIDTDILSYKGRSAYTDGTFTDGFHLDSRVGTHTKVDGVANTNWQTVSTTKLNNPPVITGDDVDGTIYEDIATRKFTLCMYGGFDGWDIYRTARTTGDEFKMNRYKGNINPNTGQGDSFSYITNNDILNLPERGITSDYYAFWAGILTFSNPADTPINVFATPGIDYVNDTLLVHEAVEMLEDTTHQKAIYIVTTPDKPFGASDSVASMYTAQDVVDNLEVSELNSSYVATYYPWVRYTDTAENKTIFLPVTRDIVKTLAHIDRTSFSWYPPAGDINGRINGTAKVSVTVPNSDILTAGRINPLITYAKDGVYAWGQKNTLISHYEDREPMTRIGVRRMMLRIRELVLRANRQLLFTPQDGTLKAKFEANTAAILNDVRSNRGISDFRIEVEDTIEARENRTLPCAVWIKPINMLEYIEINFNITPQGVEFGTNI